ncbi:rhodanese [Moraxella ovis]|uniref:Molybdopterin biosynthesis protein MoeB n=1 Tax=Moraxella ovis TaxID=29433 RepID=A0A160GE69_9GAMM|nr:rhodanese-like domain-containing protein [Moraxella ovis]ANB91188.1 rhodanese [Moraxella ovis]SPX84928.1 molybdopterin biosynthesis protein MoeB [Moraxella ovis]STY86723.1 molybdopterin biosynthesis protein MoeB [Moraxella ovis]STZ05373.1 molybdopterin biosynthesis protein MoeB [Moraxella ovis]
MERWFTFMGNHPILFGILAVLIIAFFMVEGKRNGRKVPPSELGLLVNNHRACVIDIRPANKFAVSHISGSRNIPFNELKNHLDELRAIEEPVIFVCDIGMQSGAAVSLVGKPNFMRLSGGIQGYQAAGLPLAVAKVKK